MSRSKRVLSYGHRIEHIVADGASGDDVLSLLAQHKKSAPNFSYFSESDSGMYQALNRGFARATTDLFGYLNCDDALTPGAIDEVIRTFDERPHTDLVIAHALEVRDEERCAFVMAPKATRVSRYFHEGSFLPQPSVFFRREHSGFDEKLKLLGDHDLFIRFVQSGAKVHTLERFVGVQVMSEGQLMTSQSDRAEAEFEQLMKRYNIVKSTTRTQIDHRKGLSNALMNKGAFAKLREQNTVSLKRRVLLRGLASSTKGLTYATLTPRGKRLFL